MKSPSKTSAKKSAPSKAKLGNRLTTWLQNRKLDVVVVSLLLIVAGTVSGLNMNAYPQRFEDEGTYISQAWAIQKKGALTHYTYWYDHPPAGWIQIAAYTTATNAFNRHDSAISAGREFMLVIHLATIVLLYALARRLKIGVIAAGLGTLLYALSPLVVEFSRYALLDNVALPWLLGAFLLALSPRRSLVAAIGSAICMAIAVLSKETFVVLLPVLLCALWQASDKRNWRFMLTAFGVVFIMVGGLYLLYAALKNELIPGAGHVSLLGTFFWQLLGREGSGSIFDAASGARGLVQYWLGLDYWLIAAGILALPVTFFYRHLWPIGLSLLIGLLLLLRTGYLPYPYIIVLLPFAALTIMSALQYLVITPLSSLRWKSWTTHLPASLLTLTLIAGALVFVMPAWHAKLTTLTQVDHDYSSRQAVQWIDKHVSRNSPLVVESALWADLYDKGFTTPRPAWLYKTETDPEVVKEIGGWQGIDYVVLNGPTISGNSSKDFPTVYEAIENGQIVAQFGTDNQRVVVYKIQH